MQRLGRGRGKYPLHVVADALERRAAGESIRTIRQAHGITGGGTIEYWIQKYETDVTFREAVDEARGLK